MKILSARFCLLTIAVLCLGITLLAARNQQWAEFGLALAAAILLCNFAVLDAICVRLERKIDQACKRMHDMRDQ
jgi:hypothetical protein